MGAVATLAFSLRNIDKCVEGGDKIRGVVAGDQMLGVLDTTANVLSKADGAVQSIFEKLGRSDALDKMVKQTGANSNIGALAQKTVNPLLCVAAGTRVLKDDDQYAALIEETLAMGTMFGVESVMKFARAATTGGVQATSGMAGKIASTLSKSSKISKLTENAGKWFQNLDKGEKGNAKQFLVKMGIDLLFVAGSILAYNAGHKIGEMVSNRKEKEPQKEEQQITETNTNGIKMSEYAA